MPTVDTNPYLDLPPNDLETMRRAIIAKANGNHENLDLDDLCQLAAITGVLRRRASGPPKAVKEKGVGRTKPAKAEIGDLA